MSGPAVWPSASAASATTLSSGVQTTDTSGNHGEDPHLLAAALEQQLEGCRVSRVLDVGGMSACFAACIQPHGDVAVKVTFKGSGGGSSWLAEAAEVRCPSGCTCSEACWLLTYTRK